MTANPYPNPSALGYSMPAEWAPHRATWLSWPHNQDTWPTFLERVREIWIQMICALAPHERVYVLVNDNASAQELGARLKSAQAHLANIELVSVPTVDVWMRDYGPTFVTRPGDDQPLACNDWIFNGWGGKYPAYEQDDRVARIIAPRLDIPVFDYDFVLEGGSIEVNGAGTCLTTEQCLLHQNRNPHLGQIEIEERLKAALGVRHFIWLGDGIAGDDTDGHIDDIARFVDATTLVCVVEENSRDENYRALQENFERLQGARDQDGRNITIVRLPCPAPVAYDDTRLPASYANFFVANQVVLVPVFDDPNDRVALGILQDVFPNRQVIGLRCNEVVAGLGAIHCVTQQEPLTPQRP